MLSIDLSQRGLVDRHLNCARASYGVRAARPKRRQSRRWAENLTRHLKLAKGHRGSFKATPSSTLVTVTTPHQHTFTHRRTDPPRPPRFASLPPAVHSRRARMWSPFKGKAPPSLKGTSSTAVSALNIALTTSAGVAPVALLRHSTVLETRLPQHHQRMTSDATSTSMCSPPSTVQEDSTAPSSPRPKKEEPRQVVVLLDGDHDYFKKGLLEQGHRGGKKAAIELHRRVESLVQEKEGLEAPRPDVLLMLFWSV